MISINKLAAVASLLSGLVALGGVYVHAQPPTCLRTYEVQPDDYCDKISASQNVSTYQLAAVNGGIINTECTNIWVGQIICLARTGFDCSPVVVVGSGNTCESIALTAGITYANLRANNPNINTDCSNIYPGEVVCTKLVV